MKKTNITSFAKIALQVSKKSKRPVYVEISKGDYIIACDYFILHTGNKILFDCITEKIGLQNIAHSDSLYALAKNHIFRDNLVALTDSRILAECPISGATKRFLAADDFVVAANDAYLSIFWSDQPVMLGSGMNDSVVLQCSDYSAAVLPVRGRANEREYSAMHRLIERSGWQPDREEA